MKFHEKKNFTFLKIPMDIEEKHIDDLEEIGIYVAGLKTHYTYVKSGSSKKKERLSEQLSEIIGKKDKGAGNIRNIFIKSETVIENGKTIVKNSRFNGLLFKKFCKGFDDVLKEVLGTDYKIRFQKTSEVEKFIEWENALNGIFAKEKRIGKPQIKKNIKGKTDFILNKFADKNWYAFERQANAIGRSIFKFGQAISGNKLEVEITAPIDRISTWKGFAYCDAKYDFLIIQSYHNDKINLLPRSYLIKLDDNSNQIDLCIGQSTFAEPNKVTTKSIVLHKTDDKKPVARTFTLPEQQAELKDGIYKFLYNDAENILSFPDHIFTNYDHLIEWQRNQADKKKNENRYFIGSHHVYYPIALGKITKDNVRKDTLDIEENERGDLIASYSHEVFGERIDTWKGEVSYAERTRKLFASLRGPGDKNISPIFLILNLPVEDRTIYTATGVILGLEDDYKGLTGMLVVAIKSDLKGSHTEKVAAFLNAFSNRGAIVPPENPIFDMDGLEKETVKALKR